MVNRTPGVRHRVRECIATARCLRTDPLLASQAAEWPTVCRPPRFRAFGMKAFACRVQGLWLRVVMEQSLLLTWA